MKQDARELLEVKIAYLEQASSDLSDVLFRQQCKIDQLQAQMNSLQARLMAIVSADPTASDDEQPPHY